MPWNNNTQNWWKISPSGEKLLDYWEFEDIKHVVLSTEETAAGDTLGKLAMYAAEKQSIL